MSVAGTIEYIKNVEDQFNTATNCEAIQTIIQTHTKALTDAIASHIVTIANILSDWAPLINLPSDPLKILTWASKFVTGPIGTQIALMAETAADMALLAAAIASLATSVIRAAVALAQCLESGIRQALDDITNELLDGANTLIQRAESIVDDLIAQSGAGGLNNAIEGIITDVGTIQGAITSIETSIDLIPDPT